MADAIEVIPEGWWQIVLVGMMLPAGHPCIQVRPRMPKGEKYEGPVGAWRSARIGAKGMKAAAFDNAIRAGQREREDFTVHPTPNRNQYASDLLTARYAIERELQLAGWMASFGVQPYLVRPALSKWDTGRFTVFEAVRSLEVEPVCWEYDDDSMDMVRTPGAPAPVARFQEAA
jgi:hypothetical protein